MPIALGPTLAATALPADGSGDAGAPKQIGVAVAGDSLSAAPESWLHQLDDPGIVAVGGFQRSGYTSGQVLDEITAVPDADVLVVMLGTNDLKRGVADADTGRNIERIVEKVGAPHVLISFIPPSDATDWNPGHHDLQRGGIVENRTLTAVAAEHGWMVADPFAPIRSFRNGYAAGTTTDGIHPTATVDTGVAERMTLYIRQAHLAAAGARPDLRSEPARLARRAAEAGGSACEQAAALPAIPALPFRPAGPCSVPGAWPAR
ncbi:SGNH/GDSL hydrolase family protein [Amnibacterium sp. CER49]|uniref:SGNH/GDSL hydrolase family protein n=1 Tax=Amnibacterium sp. CER49 TaxID=3039161 RepID=UPI00244C2EE6|nr:SGNH/GDSL hydrolase family protein [Amnibacterium sp. CER49]MDH2445410.1 SGNH/GDSL hydrolase family protein [Amnibacterium sp. CER49]